MAKIKTRKSTAMSHRDEDLNKSHCHAKGIEIVFRTQAEIDREIDNAGHFNQKIFFFLYLLENILVFTVNSAYALF